MFSGDSAASRSAGFVTASVRRASSTGSRPGSGLASEPPLRIIALFRTPDDGAAARSETTRFGRTVRGESSVETVRFGLLPIEEAGRSRRYGSEAAVGNRLFTTPSCVWFGTGRSERAAPIGGPRLRRPKNRDEASRTSRGPPLRGRVRSYTGCDRGPAQNRGDCFATTCERSSTSSASNTARSSTETIPTSSSPSSTTGTRRIPASESVSIVPLTPSLS